jgi:putative addiction module component (TIGR02574 family)
MSVQLEKCEQQAKHLSLKERAILIRRLIEGLDEFDEHSLEQQWLQEASKRLQAYRDGDIRARSSVDTFADVRAKLREM